MALKVLSIQAGASFQDGGRVGYRKFGVPDGGAFDRGSLAQGNRLLGNDPFAPAIEFTIMGGRFEADTQTTGVVAGADCEVKINGSPVHRLFQLKTGDVLEIGPAWNGARSYLCVSGGFVVEETLGSVSGGKPVVGQSYQCGPAVHPPQGQNLNPLPKRNVLRAFLGPDLERSCLGLVFGPVFSVSPNSNRVGVRLDGDPHNWEERTSEPMCVGTVQATSGGQLIIVGPDGPTVGGYPKVAVVCREDMDLVAQALPGESVRFELVC